MGDGEEWRERRDQVFAGLSGEWETVHVRHGGYVGRPSFETALGGRTIDVLGPGFEDAYDLLTLVGSSADEASHRWKANLTHHWSRVYGRAIDAAERARRAYPDPLSPFATVPREDEAKPPYRPIHVSVLLVERRPPMESLRIAIVENEGRVRPDGKRRVGGVIAGFRGLTSFTRDWHQLSETSPYDWEKSKARMLSGLEESATSVDRSTSSFLTPEAFLDAVGPRFLKGIGGRKAMDVLAPVEAPREILPLRKEGTGAGRVKALPDATEQADPLFGAF